MITGLKEKVLLAYKSPVNSAKDCALLAKEIQVNTGRNMSETTIRRFFGLLKSKSHLSQYNLDTLAIYCGYQDFDQFSSKSPNNKGTSTLEQEFDKITHYTLNSISKKSLTPFEQTIPRITVNKALNIFLASELPVYIIEAPGGYGKSTVLAHWVKSYIDKGKNILFIQAAVMINYLHDSNDFLFDLASQTNVFTKWKEHKASSPLIIIIDSWEEVNYLSQKQEQLLTYINQVVQLFSADISLKIILSFRTSTWEQISRSKPKGRKFTIQGLPGHSLPPFSNDEIRTVIDIVNNKTEQPIIYERILWDTLELLKVPFNLYLYTKLNAFYDANETIGYNRLLEIYFKEKVFEAKYAEEKEDILWALIAFISSANTISMPKKMLKQAYPVHIKRETNYFKAYADLLAESILEEERIVNKYGLYSTVVQFKHHNYLFYLTALDMIRQNNGLSAQMFKNIVWSDHFWTWKTNIVAILFELAYNNEDFEAIEQFCELPDKIHNSLKVRYTVGKAFRNNNGIRDKVIQQFARSENGQTYYFEQFVDTNYLFNNYVYRIKEYLKNKSTKEAILFGNSILFLAGFLKLNQQECSRYKQIVDTIEVDSTFHPWLAGRKVATALMYHGFIKKSNSNNSLELIKHIKKKAYAYQGYFSRGLVTFELPVLVPLVFSGQYELIVELLSHTIKRTDLQAGSDGFISLLAQNQNSIPVMVLEYAKFKLDERYDTTYSQKIESALVNINNSYDDFQYQIMLRWILFDYYKHSGDDSKAQYHHQTALQLSMVAGYNFFEMFLRVNATGVAGLKKKLLLKEIESEGFISKAFEFV